MNFRGDANGGDIVVLSGTAEVDESRPSAAENAAWVAKYASEWERVGMTAESFATRLVSHGYRDPFEVIIAAGSAAGCGGFSGAV